MVERSCSCCCTALRQLMRTRENLLLRWILKQGQAVKYYYSGRTQFEPLLQLKGLLLNISDLMTQMSSLQLYSVDDSVFLQCAFPIIKGMKIQKDVETSIVLNLIQLYISTGRLFMHFLILTFHCSLKLVSNKSIHRLEVNPKQ